MIGPRTIPAGSLTAAQGDLVALLVTVVGS